MNSADSTPSADRRRIPRLTLTEAIRRHWFVAALPVVVLVAAGIALGISRTPVYTAETRMQVGNLDLSQPGALGGFTTAGETLAESFSRAVDADAVVDPVSKQLDLPPDAVRSQVSATPVPQSPVFRVVGTAGSASAAVDLTNQAARYLRRYSASLYRPADRSARLYSAYKRAGLEYSKLLDRQLNLDRREDSAAFVSAEAAARAASARVAALRNSYLQSAAAKESAPATAHVLVKATGASSDRQQVLQIYIFIGLVAGVVGGAALANVVASRAVRRSLATL
jgi:capsular polysaccharide biosynthesis protein